MGNSWFRLYNEFANDPKVQMMSEAMQRRLVMLFCLRSEETAITDEVVGFALRLDEEQVRETRELFIKKGFIDSNWNLENWNRRQFLSDSSADRVRRYRERKKQAETSPVTDDVTDGNVTVTPPDTDTEADTEQKVSKTSSSHPGAKPGKVDPVEAIYRQYPRKIAPGTAFKAIKTAHKRLMNGESPLEPLSDRDAYAFLYRRVIAYARSPDGSNPDRSKVPHPATWFNRKSYLDDVTEWDSILTEGKKPAVVPLQQRIYTDPAEAHA